MKTWLDWAKNFHDKMTIVVGYCAKNPGICILHIFHQSDEKGIFSNFSSFEGKCVFHNMNLKIMKIDIKVNFLKPYFLITRIKPLNPNIPYR